MSSSLIELARLEHEIAEKYEELIGEYLDEKPNGQKAKVVQQKSIKEMVNKIVNANQELMKIYVDSESLLLDEVKSIRGSEMFTSFYSSLNAAREYHQKHPSAAVSTEFKPDINVEVNFSGEEVFGKYFDLNALHLEFCNLTKNQLSEQDYLQYLDRFNSFFYIPAGVKSKAAYLEYLNHLWSYLFNFFSSVNPLTSLDSMLQEWRTEFDAKHPQQDNKENGGAPSAKEPLRLGMFNDVSELESLGMDRLKEALEALGLKCGGTLKDRAARLWSVRGLKRDAYPKNILAKGVGSTGGSKADHEREVAWNEHKITLLCEVLRDTVTATRHHAEKQQTRSAEEKLQEIRDEEFGVASAAVEPTKDGDDEEPLYNPLNIPLGWDGKPIPFWLYKLHGLGVEYKCQICGDQSYWGRRAFDRHFQEWKHSQGMRSLGVPNTKHFHDIVLIEDVLALYAKIKDQLKVEQFTKDLDEEFEDTEGNVLNKRTYEDLARQGLL